MTTELISVADLYCERDERVLFSQLNFTLSAGEVAQVEGPNGSGKTTLLRIIAGLNQDFDGEIAWCAEPIDAVRSDFNRNLLYFGHQPGVKAALTPYENLSWYAAMQPGIRKEDITSALSKVGLSGFEDVPCSNLSAGQHRRVSLARLYLSDAIVWILDEPFTAIDKVGVAEKEALIAEHAARGGAVLLTTHHELNLPCTVKTVRLGNA
ncbi:MAG: cytochrome c biogenesis heme-transporting ATPase CcmA [Pontibacterium sp.]